MASVVGVASAAADNVALPAHQAGDLILIAARLSGITLPGLPSGWTGIQADNQYNLSMRTGFRKAVGPTHVSGTWLNATHVTALVLRGDITPSALPTAPVITTVLDNFNRADGNLTAGATWSAGSMRDATGPNIGVTSNVLVKRATTGGWDEALSSLTIGPDLDLAYDIVAPPSGSANVQVRFALANVQTASLSGWGCAIDAAFGEWTIFQQVASTQQNTKKTITRAMPAAGDSIWVSVRGTLISLYHKLSGSGTWTLVTNWNDTTRSVAVAGRFGMVVTGSVGVTKIDNLIGGTAPAINNVNDLGVVASSTGTGPATLTDVDHPALTLTKRDKTSHGVRALTRGAASNLATSPNQWINQVVQPAGASALLAMYTRMELAANPTKDNVFLSVAAAFRGNTIEVSETPAPVPTWEDSIDTFDRANGLVYAGAGALGGARIWNSTYITAIGPTVTKHEVQSNRLFSNSSGVNEGHTRVSLAASCDLIVDIPVAAALSGYLYLFFALSGAGNSNSATGYVLRVRNASATLDDWAIGTIVNGDYDNNMYVFSNNVPKLPAGGGIWIAKRGQTLSAYKRDSATANWVRIINWTDNQFDRAGTVGIGVTQDQTVRIDNLRGGPQTWPPEYYPNQQTMMT